MEHTQTLQVDTRKLLNSARQYGLFLASVAGITLAPTASWKEVEQQLPERFDLATLMPVADPSIYLELIDALAGDAHVKQAGRLFLAMARRFYLPLLPSDHDGYAPAQGLLDALSAWIEGKGCAEDYVATAFRFRCQYGTTYSAMGNHPEYDFLFEALPSGGLDCALGEGCWNLASSWRSFCRHAASTDRDWELLDTLTDDLDAAGFSPDVREAVLCEVFDPMRETLTDGASDSYINELAKLVIAYFPQVQVGGEED